MVSIKKIMEKKREKLLKKNSKIKRIKKIILRMVKDSIIWKENSTDKKKFITKNYQKMKNSKR